MTIKRNESQKLIIACDVCKFEQPVDKNEFVRSQSTNNTRQWDKLTDAGWFVFLEKDEYLHCCPKHNGRKR